MSTRVASIFAEIGLDSSNFTKGAKDVLGGLGDMIGSLGKLPGVLGVVGTAIGMVVNELDKMEQAAVASAKEDAKLEAVIQSTGSAAGLTAIELDTLASQMSKNIGVDDEMIKSGEAVLLTFTNVKEQAFEETMQAAADMAAVLGGDLNGKLTQIGKAMNDFDGYVALKRSGVVFSDEQERQIKNFKETNDLAGYQALVLQELQKEYGGAAKAMNEAGDGQENLQIAWENYQEASGKGMITLKRQWNEFWTGIWEGATEARTKTDEYNDTLRELGLSATQYGWFVDGAKITKEQADAMIFAHNVAEVATDRYDKMAGAIAEVGTSAELTESQIASMNDENKTSISLAEQFTNMATLTADEQEKATKRIVLSLLEQKLAIGGLSDEETQFLLDKGVEWGVYSATAIEEMRKAETEASILAGYINNIPDAKNITITTIYRSLVEGGTAESTAAQIAKGVAAGNIAPYPYAKGGSFTVPNSYGYEGFNMGGIATASAGEVVTITPKNEVNPITQLAEPQNITPSIDYDRLARVLTESLERSGLSR